MQQPGDQPSYSTAVRERGSKVKASERPRDRGEEINGGRGEEQERERAFLCPLLTSSQDGAGPGSHPGHIPYHQGSSSSLASELLEVRGARRKALTGAAIPVAPWGTWAAGLYPVARADRKATLTFHLVRCR